jgi:hypothetical protein
MTFLEIPYSHCTIIRTCCKFIVRRSKTVGEEEKQNIHRYFNIHPKNFPHYVQFRGEINQRARQTLQPGASQEINKFQQPKQEMIRFYNKYQYL